MKNTCFQHIYESEISNQFHTDMRMHLFSNCHHIRLKLRNQMVDLCFTSSILLIFNACLHNPWAEQKPTSNSSEFVVSNFPHHENFCFLFPFSHWVTTLHTHRLIRYWLLRNWSTRCWFSCDKRVRHVIMIGAYRSWPFRLYSSFLLPMF